MCSSEQASYFYEFVKEIFSLKFDECPNYLSLTLKLLQIMNQLGLDFTNEYDWSIQE